MADFATADLCDLHEKEVRVLTPLFRSYGGHRKFCGEVETLRVFEDNVLVRKALERHVEGKVLVVDGGGSLRCALVGDRLAAIAAENGWAGIVVNGCVRDVAQLQTIGLGILALASSPLRSAKTAGGEVNVTVTIAGVEICAGEYLYADSDGVVIAGRKLC